MKKFLRIAVLFLSLNLLLAQAATLTSRVEGQTKSTHIQIAGDRDLLSPDPISVIRNLG